jgi:hypothetical protein
VIVTPWRGARKFKTDAGEKPARSIVANTPTGHGWRACARIRLDGALAGHRK